MIEKAMASGINASATTIPESKSPLILDSQCCLQEDGYILKMTSLKRIDLRLFGLIESEKSIPTMGEFGVTLNQVM